uniref:Uncharacterized protein n=1 Tax=Arundo donax TaxID=35708 RepID=A0A0A9B442_ARUDO
MRNQSRIDELHPHCRN